MSKKLTIIACTPNNLRFVWETSIYLTSLRKYNLSQYAHILVFLTDKIPGEVDIKPEWIILQQDFPEAKIHFYHDDGNIYKIAQSFHYIPIHRLFLLQKHFKNHPELKNDAILYTDTDIILTNPLPLDKFLHDDVNYISWTGNKERTDNYLWQPYIDGKIANVQPAKLEFFKKHDVLQKMGDVCSITRELITNNNQNTGGAQYLLKNIDSQFWTDCFNSCLEIKLLLATMNQTYMKGANGNEKENNGYQSFCADMWAVLYNLWKRGAQTSCPEEFDFAWSTDRIERAFEVSFLHNAGVTSESKIKIPYEGIELEGPLFYKGKYTESTPFDNMDEIYAIHNHPVNRQFCNNLYAQAIIETKNNISWHK